MKCGLLQSGTLYSIHDSSTTLMEHILWGVRIADTLAHTDRWRILHATLWPYVIPCRKEVARRAGGKRCRQSGWSMIPQSQAQHRRRHRGWQMPINPSFSGEVSKPFHRSKWKQTQAPARPHIPLKSGTISWNKSCIYTVIVCSILIARCLRKWNHPSIHTVDFSVSRWGF